jgi:hypothetical protein
LTAAVRTAEEYLQIGSTRQRLAAVDTEEGSVTPVVSQLEKLMMAVAQNAEAISKLAQSGVGRSYTRKADSNKATFRKKIECFHCKGEHFKRDCPELKDGRVNAMQGNEECPQE